MKAVQYRLKIWCICKGGPVVSVEWKSEGVMEDESGDDDDKDGLTTRK